MQSHLIGEDFEGKAMPSCPMRLISWNVANRVKKLPLQVLGLRRHEPHIVVLQEVTATTIPLWRRALEERRYGVITSFDLAKDHTSLTGGRKYGVLTASRWPM